MKRALPWQYKAAACAASLLVGLRAPGAAVAASPSNVVPTMTTRVL